MRRIIIFALTLVSALLTMSCKPEVNKDLVWPEWASRPVIQNASLISLDGQKTVVAGQRVTYSADVSDEYNELLSYSLTVKYGSSVVWETEEAISGSEFHINKEFNMPFAPNLEDGGYIPEVTLKVVNVKNGSFSQRLNMDYNVTVTRPVLPGTLYILDNKGNKFALTGTGKDFNYILSEDADLSVLGESFHIVEKSSGNSPDFSGLVWGDVNGKLAVVNEASPYASPSSEGYGFKRMEFSAFTFELNKVVNLSYKLKKEDMEVEDHGGVTYYCLKNVKLVKDCEFVFDGFGDLESFLQPDRFQILDDKTAKFTGHTAVWSVYYDSADNWLIVNYAVNNTTNQIWVTGENACYPLGDDSTENSFKYLDGDGKTRYATLSALRHDAEHYSCLLYLKEDYHLQLYRYMKWSTVMSMKSLTPETATITDDGVYIKASSDFTPGVYMLDIYITEEMNSVGDGCKADISITPYEL